MCAIGASDRAEIERLEHAMWRAETRFDRAFMDAALAPDFAEFGRSGTVYDRDSVLALPSSGELVARLHELALHPLDDDVVLMTYVSEVTHETVDFAHRASIWVRAGGGWRLRFHQGTPCTAVAPNRAVAFDPTNDPQRRHARRFGSRGDAGPRE